MSTNSTSSTSSTGPPIIPLVDYIYSGICLTCFLVGVPANAFSFYCFNAQRRSVSSVVYTCITAVDCLICLNALPVGITYMTLRDDLIFGNEVFCNLWGVTHRLLSSLSIFYVAVLSISRTIVLLRPFSRLKMVVVQASIAIHFLMQVTFALIPYWEEGGRYVYMDFMASCEIPVTLLNKYENVSVITSQITYSVPIFPILISCVISVYILMRDADQLQEEQRDTKRYASVTIVMFTLMYATFNIANTTISIFKLSNTILEIDPEGYSLNFVYYLSIMLNSTLNPVLYMIRMHQLRTSIKTALVYMCSKERLTLDKNMLSVTAAAVRISRRGRLYTKPDHSASELQTNLSRGKGEIVLPRAPIGMRVEGGPTSRLGGLCPGTPTCTSTTSLKLTPLPTPKSSHRRL